MHEAVYLVFMAAMVLLLFLSAAACTLRARLGGPRFTSRGLMVGLAALTTALGANAAFNWTVARANFAHKRATNLDYLKARAPAFGTYERAIRLDRTLMVYRLKFAASLLEQAQATTDTEGFRTLARRAEQTLLDAQRLNPRHRTYHQLANVYSVWATREAVRHYENAAAVSKNPFGHHSAAGKLSLDVGEPELALRCYEAARKAASAKDLWQAEERLADTYRVLQDKPSALNHVQHAIETAPPANQRQVQQLKDQIQQSP